MINRNIIICSFFFLFLIFISCRKNNNGSPSAPTGKLKVSLTYPQNSFVTDSVELIISERGGKILLDTFTFTDVTVNASLNTNDTLVNLTTIARGSNSPNTYQANSFLAINPSSWTNDSWSPYYSHYAAYGDTYTSANIRFTNVPDTNYFFGAAGYGGRNYNMPQNGTLDIKYDNGDNYAYLLFPDLKRYKLVKPTIPFGTVDITSTDTAYTVNFIKPSSMTLGIVDLWGVADTNNYSNITRLYQDQSGFNVGGQSVNQLLYPAKYFQKYQMNVFAFNNQNENFNYYSYGDSIPTILTFADPSYTFLSTQADNFSVKFSEKPSIYYFSCDDGWVQYSIYAPPDSVTLHPVSFLKNQGSKNFQIQNFTASRISAFGFNSSPGLNYAAYLNYVCNKERVQKERLPIVKTYVKIITN